MRKTIKHKVHTIEEKNEIVKEYLVGDSGYATLLRKYDIASRSMLHRWIKQYRETKSAFDNRGKASKKGISGRKKQLKPENMTREELIKYVEAVEEIKKLMAFLKKQNKNIK